MEDHGQSSIWTIQGVQGHILDRMGVWRVELGGGLARRRPQAAQGQPGASRGTKLGETESAQATFAYGSNMHERQHDAKWTSEV